MTISKLALKAITNAKSSLHIKFHNKLAVETKELTAIDNLNKACDTLDLSFDSHKMIVNLVNREIKVKYNRVSRSRNVRNELSATIDEIDELINVAQLQDVNL